MSLSILPSSPTLTLPSHHMPLLRQLRRLRPLRRKFSAIAAAAESSTATTTTPLWTQAPLSHISPAAESLYNISIDVSDSPYLAASHTKPGQYLQLRIPDIPKPVFLAIASAPRGEGKELEFLVKSVEGSTAEAVCGLRRGDVVEVSEVMGNGFEVEKIEPPEKVGTVLIFATGSGISPIRSLIEFGFGADKRSDVRLYYGARNLKRMAYQDRFKDWESSGVKIIPVLSQPEKPWTGETGYVQAAFSRARRILNPGSTGVFLCGQKQMAEAQNEQFSSTFNLEDFKASREKRFKQIQAAVAKYREIKENINEGMKFYVTLQDAITNMKQQCIDFVMTRSIQCREMVDSVQRQLSGFSFQDRNSGSSFQDRNSGSNTYPPVGQAHPIPRTSSQQMKDGTMAQSSHPQTPYYQPPQQQQAPGYAPPHYNSSQQQSPSYAPAPAPAPGPYQAHQPQPPQGHDYGQAYHEWGRPYYNNAQQPGAFPRPPYSVPGPYPPPSNQ
ncbi:Fruit protein pKIWI502-like protein, partial [Drosera capensis]